jgi:MFS family permease
MPSDIGLVFGVGNLIAASLFVPIGIAADRWGRRGFLIATWISSTLGAAAFLPLADWRGAFVGSVLYWTGSACVPLMTAHLAATTARARLGREMGLVYGAFFAGTLVAAPFAGLLASAVGTREAMAIAVAAFALSSALTFTLARPATVSRAAGTLPRAFWTLLAITPLAALIAVVVNPLYPVYLREIAAVPLERVGVFVALVALGSAIFPALSGRSADAFGPVPALVGAGAILVIGAGTIALSGRSEASLAIGSFLLGAQIAPNPVLASILERVVSPSRWGLGFAGFQTAYALGFGSGAVLAGVLYETDPLLPLLVQVAFGLPVTALIAVIVARLLARA